MHDKTFTVMKPILAWTGMGWEDEVGVGEGLSQIKNWGGVILLLWHRVSRILTYRNVVLEFVYLDIEGVV